MRSRVAPRILRTLHRACIVACVGLAFAAMPAGAAGSKALSLSLVNGALQQKENTVRLKQGDDVELRWTSDRPITLHLHGYDIEKKVEPGKPTVMSFKASIPGRFPVEVHGGAAHRPVLYLEVYP
jgi:FtsP/CotA-like multicopper oxidase with cupredoxin domain